jgi:hypothetical protein
LLQPAKSPVPCGSSGGPRVEPEDDPDEPEDEDDPPDEELEVVPEDEAPEEELEEEPPEEELPEDELPCEPEDEDDEPDDEPDPLELVNGAVEPLSPQAAMAGATASARPHAINEIRIIGIPSCRSHNRVRCVYPHASSRIVRVPGARAEQARRRSPERTALRLRGSDRARFFRKSACKSPRSY